MAKQRKKKRHLISKTILSLLLICITTAAICGVAFAWYIHSYINPSIEALDLNAISLNLTSIIYAKDPATGEFVEYEKLHGEQNRIWVDMKDIPKYMGQAFVAVEDQRFYTHKGVDWKRTLGAAFKWVGGGSERAYGGSTITQQLIKNVTNNKDYSIRRKINEIFHALALEKEVGDKDRLLEMYMNTIPFGNNAYGVGAAAHTYFNKDVSQLSLAECAAIAGVTNAPTKYNPFRNPENTKARQGVILDLMFEQGMISESQRVKAKAEELHYERPADEANVNEPYTYFTDTILQDLIQDLHEKKGYSEQLATQIVYTGGLKIYATVDAKVQSVMDSVYAGEDNFPNISKNGEKPQSAMVIMKPGGEIVGIVGGRGAKENSRSLNRATQSKRQPGSSIKPISTYGPAMDAGLITPYSGMIDEAFQELNGKPWPRNDNGQYSGPIILKNAVARSVNTIAVKTLDMLTPEASYAFLTEKLGMDQSIVDSRTQANGKVVSDIGLASLGLGGLTDGVTVRQMAGGYGIFVNGGDFVKPFTYSKVLDSEGNTLLSNESPEAIHAFENEKTTYYMNETLQGVTRAGGTASSAKVSGMDTAGKTGTTTANRDRWFCGYTPYYVGACWFGYDQNYSLSGLSSNPATNLWKKVMFNIHEGLPDASFPKAGSEFSRVKYCTQTGLLPVAGCETETGLFYKGDAPKQSCAGHVVEEIPLEPQPGEIDPETGLPYPSPDPEGGTPDVPPAGSDEPDEGTTPTPPSDTTEGGGSAPPPEPPEPPAPPAPPEHIPVPPDSGVLPPAESVDPEG